MCSGRHLAMVVATLCEEEAELFLVADVAPTTGGVRPFPSLSTTDSFGVSETIVRTISRGIVRARNNERFSSLGLCHSRHSTRFTPALPVVLQPWPSRVVVCFE